MPYTAAQLELIGLLVAEALTDRRLLERRWDRAAPIARQRAAEGQLLLTRHWTSDVLLSTTGEVFVIETEDGAAPRQAEPRESRVALFESIARYPELMSFLPSRPAEAVMCSVCEGTGVVKARFKNEALKHVVCVCGGAGWTMPGDSQDSAL